MSTVESSLETPVPAGKVGAVAISNPGSGYTDPTPTVPEPDTLFQLLYRVDRLDERLREREAEITRIAEQIGDIVAERKRLSDLAARALPPNHPPETILMGPDYHPWRLVHGDLYRLPVLDAIEVRVARPTADDDLIDVEYEINDPWEDRP